jgi:ribosomal protein L11 methyltransferase
MTDGDIKTFIMAEVSESNSKILPGELEKKISYTFNIAKKESRRHIGQLVDQGELAYTYLFGTSFIEKSFHKPVRMSKHIILVPAGGKKNKTGPFKEIVLSHGASFGTGRHPTTRLAIRSIENVFEETAFQQDNLKTSALDIGTGSGILAIASVLLGIGRATGTDIESCARKEARENVELNGLTEKIMISDQEPEELKGPFSLIAANLRYPTLIALHAHIKRLTTMGGALVLSGIKTQESQRICKVYSDGFHFLWQEEEKEWVCIVFKRI